MKKIIPVVLFGLLFFNLVPSIEKNNETSRLTIKSPFEAYGFHIERGFTQSHYVVIPYSESMDTDDGFCLRSCAEGISFETCSPGQEPCGANMQPRSSWGCGGWTCHVIEI